MKPLPPDTPAVQLCAFYLGDTEYVVDLMRVEEILPLQEITSVPAAPPFVAGVTKLRGGIVPVVDARQRLQVGPAHPHLKPKLLVCLLGRNRVALRVDGVAEVLRLPISELKPTPPLSGTASPGYVIGACGTPDRLRLLLNLRALLQP